MPSDRVIEMLFYHIRALLPTQLLIPLAAHCRLNAYRGGTVPLIAVGGGVAWACDRQFDGSLPSPATLASLAPLIASWVVPEILTAVRPAAALIAAWQRQASDRPSPSPSPSASLPSPSAAPPPLPLPTLAALTLSDDEAATVSPFDAAHAGWRLPLLRKRERSWSFSADSSSERSSVSVSSGDASSDEDEGAAAAGGGQGGQRSQRQRVDQ